jgi:tRNA U34 5-methylaminomethyl-2-thiouridine-forming methyltransferase MnmC
MQRQPVITKDGSYTISVPAMNVTYHSMHGAIQESMHVFIEAGLHYPEGRFGRPPGSDDRPPGLNILEMGFGTGLNALLTLIESEKGSQIIHYTSIELFPLNKEEIAGLNYCELLQRPDLQPVFNLLHECEWQKDIPITPVFTLRKTNTSLIDYQPGYTNHFHLVYYDAFAPLAQPELWTKEIFEKLYTLMAPEGILVTYCSKGDVRRAMQAAGFKVEKIQGPPGKREMVRSLKK